MRVAHRFGQRKTIAAPPSSYGLLSQHPLFSGLQEPARKAFVAQGSLVRIPKYSLLFHQGDEITAAYLILEGLVKLYRDLRDSDRTLGFLYKGDMVGLDAAFAPDGHTYSAQALGFVTVCAFPREAILSLVQTAPEFGPSLLRDSARQMDEALTEQDRLSSQSANGRIAGKILALAEKFGRADSEGGVVLQLKITQREMASMAGTNRESVCKALLVFKREGSIDIQDKLIVIKNKSKLASWP